MRRRLENNDCGECERLSLRKQQLAHKQQVDIGRVFDPGEFHARVSNRTAGLRADAERG